MKLNLENIFDHLPAFLRRHQIAQMLLRIAPESSIQLVKFNGNARLYADLKDPMPRSYFLTRSFDPEFIEIAKTFLPQNGTFFDAGANFGFCSFGLLSQAASRNISAHLFEANPALCDLLKRSLTLYPGQKIAVCYGALARRKGTSKFSINPKHLGASYVEKDQEGETPNLVLDDYVKSLNIQKVDFLKMDLEGFEPAVLEGAAESLKKGVYKVIYTEVSTMNLSRYGWTPKDIFEPLKAYGYRLFWIKKEDFKAGICEKEKKTALRTKAGQLQAASLSYFPESYQTDILAVHPSAEVQIL